jgi:hypothetical protein
MANCRSCGAEIEWAVTEKDGKPTPVNPEPVPGGTILLRHVIVGKPPIAHVTTKDEREELSQQARSRGEESVLFVSHFATCNDPERWRKK